MGKSHHRKKDGALPDSPTASVGLHCSEEGRGNTDKRSHLDFPSFSAGNKYEACSGSRRLSCLFGTSSGCSGHFLLFGHQFGEPARRTLHQCWNPGAWGPSGPLTASSVGKTPLPLGFSRRWTRTSVQQKRYLNIPTYCAVKINKAVSYHLASEQQDCLETKFPRTKTEDIFKTRSKWLHHR
ncbi:uncharacterized protein LOC119140077 isoform X1 [Falco rusticolus]|uniref:uncharacterized protein LOC119140077 isoform X1 n=1 Tax=Falco rusticolus TaxID=120794 RepID=UPI0018866881|nr:uncharacterized protein LOC119140077 isoform X1 [Falco rusticolus]